MNYHNVTHANAGTATDNWVPRVPPQPPTPPFPGTYSPVLVGLVESCIVADVDARPGTQALPDSIYAAWTPFVTGQHGTQCDMRTREERLQWNSEFRVARLTKKDDYRVGLAVGNFPN